MIDAIGKALHEKRKLEDQLEYLREQHLRGDLELPEYEILRESTLSGLQEVNETIERIRFESQQEVGRLNREIERLRSELKSLDGQLDAGGIAPDKYAWKSKSLHKTIANIEEEIASVNASLLDEPIAGEPLSEGAKYPSSLPQLGIILAKDLSRTIAWAASLILVLSLFLPLISENAVKRYLRNETEELGELGSFVSFIAEGSPFLATICDNSSIYRMAFGKTFLDLFGDFIPKSELDAEIAKFKNRNRIIFFAVIAFASINVLICMRRVPLLWRIVQVILAVLVIMVFLSLKLMDPAQMTDDPLEATIMSFVLYVIGPGLYVFVGGAFCLGVSALPVNRLVRLPSPSRGEIASPPWTTRIAKDLVPSLSTSEYIALAAVGICLVSLFLPWISDSGHGQMSFNHIVRVLAEEGLVSSATTSIVFVLLAGALVTTIYSGKGTAILTSQIGLVIGTVLLIVHVSDRALSSSRAMGEAVISGFFTAPGFSIFAAGAVVVWINGVMKFKKTVILLPTLVSAGGVMILYCIGAFTGWFGFHQSPPNLHVQLNETEGRVFAYAEIENPGRRKLWIRQTSNERGNSYHMRHLIRRSGSEEWEESNVEEWRNLGGKACLPAFLGPKESCRMERTFSSLLRTDEQGNHLKQSQAGTHMIFIEGKDLDERITASFDIEPLENPEWLARQLLDRAEILREEERLQEAHNVISELQQSYPSTQAASLARRAESAIEDAQAEEMRRKREIEAQGLLGQIEAAMQSEEYERAQTLCEQALRDYPEFSPELGIPQMLSEAKLLQDPSERRFRAIEKRIQRESYEDSINLLEEFLLEYPDSRRAEDARQAIEENDTEKERADYLYQYAEEYFAEGEYSIAARKYRALTDNYRRSRWVPNAGKRLEEIRARTW